MPRQQNNLKYLKLHGAPTRYFSNQRCINVWTFCVGITKHQAQLEVNAIGAYEGRLVIYGISVNYYIFCVWKYMCIYSTNV